MPQHRLLTPADYRRMPWKNGAGRTTEIASYPPAAALDDFDWRVSIADVGKDGPFSQFTGIDRMIVVIDGAGMRLSGAGHAALLHARDEPYAFSGDDAIASTLVDGPVRDFNLMLRRERVRGAITVVRGEAARIPPARFCICYVVSGTFECLLAARPPLAVATDHALLVDDVNAVRAPFSINPLTADANAVVATIEPLA